MKARSTKHEKINKHETRSTKSNAATFRISVRNVEGSQCA